jgi:DNA polymerase elongation subunit (family B)
MKILLFDLENVMRPENMFHPGKRSKFGGRQAGFCADLASILVFGYKWLGEEAQAIHLDKKQFKATPMDDTLIIQKAMEVMDSADVVVTWYGKGHDLPFLNSRLARIGLYLDPKIRHVDLIDVAKKQLRLSSNSLNNVAKFFGVEQKSSVSHKLWADCWQGNYDSLLEMTEYCKQDCNVLEQVYHKMLALGTNLPHIGKLTKPGVKHSCPSCGGVNYQGNGSRVTLTKKYQRLRCSDCGTSFAGETL